MSVIRIHKNKNFTVMSNIHLKDKNLSLKAKGLLSLMLSLPDDWKYSVSGLCAICKENETAVKTALNELREYRYVIVKKQYPTKENNGRIKYEYEVYEEPQPEEKQSVEKQGIENLGVECQYVENPLQLNTNKSSTDELKKDKLKTDNNSLSSERASESESAQTKRQNRKKEANELFERVWKLYPKKIGKGQVSDTQKLRLLDIGYDELSRAVQRCCEYNKDKDKQYWQNGSTFFNSGYVDFLDENYEDSNSFSGAEVKESQKETLSEKERVRMGKEEAKEKLGYGEEYWDGMDDGQISVMLEYMGIFIDQY